MGQTANLLLQIFFPCKIFISIH